MKTTQLRAAFRGSVILSATKYYFKILTVSSARTTTSTNTPKIKEPQGTIAQDCGDPWRPGKLLLLSQQDGTHLSTDTLPQVPITLLTQHMLSSATHVHPATLLLSVYRKESTLLLVGTMALLPFLTQLLTSIYSPLAASSPAGCFLLEVGLIAPALLSPSEAAAG